MIPGTAVPATRLPVDDSVQPVKPTASVTDILSEFKPGQRLVAEIQSQNPNGTYRALIAQRDVTLSLPFSAKSGDSLELEVIDHAGRLTFAVAAPPADDMTPKESARTTISLTGQLIGSLLPKERSDPQGMAPLVLKGGAPVLAAPPAAGDRVSAPAMQAALSGSGIMYESHQAAWVQGRTQLDAILRDPQGQRAATDPTTAPPDPARARAPLPDVQRATSNVAPHGIGGPARPFPGAGLPPDGPTSMGYIENATATAAVPASSANGYSIPADVLPIVQQQLNALATNVFAWQGQLWPGQSFEWEIVDGDAEASRHDLEGTPSWKTRLRLTLPTLGPVEAILTLRGAAVQVSLEADEAATRDRLTAERTVLRRQFTIAGLELSSVDILPPSASRSAASGAELP